MRAILGRDSLATAPDKIQLISKAAAGSRRESREIILGEAANEFVFAVVGHVGSGTSTIARTLQTLLRDQKIQGKPFDTAILKARDSIETWAKTRNKELPSANAPKSVEHVKRLQDYGDQMRAETTRNNTQDHAAVARQLVLQIRRLRAQKTGKSPETSGTIVPESTPRAYILDCLRHPAEVHFLRRIYEDSFVLIGVVCEEEKRRDRIRKKYPDCGEGRLKLFMDRDADAEVSYGQHVEQAFQLADFFIDNTVDRLVRGNEPNPDWDVTERLSRLVKIVTHSEVIRPDITETGMYHAYTARMQSACLSRQVGAALVDRAGNVVAVGTNEVPKAGGGVYGESFGPGPDFRCAMYTDPANRYCRNTREQNQIIDDVIAAIPELHQAQAERKRQLPKELRKTRIGELLEFSRAVHAEMEALLSAARKGVSTLGMRIFVTTFPCHYCARHLITAGIDEVQYLEPYRKSRALGLHEDAIQVENTGWKPPSEGGRTVLFRPFSGVAPGLYRRAFLKDRELKDRDTGTMKIQEPEWGTPWHLPRTSYVEIEAELAREERSDVQ